MVAIPVNPDVLIWAREERRLSIELAAKRLEIDEGDLRDLETGQRLPTLGELQTIAQKYKIALASLLMPGRLPATTRPQLHDFRSFGGQRIDLSYETILAIEEVNEHIETMCELRAELPSLFTNAGIPECRLSDDPEQIAVKERNRTWVLVEAQLGWQKDREAFLQWREIIEAQGIFVYMIKLGEDDSRGFSVWDDRELAAIVIDASEGSYGAKIFTLLHEYAHILLRLGGISDQNRSNRIEGFCNQFAAFFLMPRNAFVAEANAIKWASGNWSEWHVGRLAARFKVSKSAAALHMETTGLAPSGFYQEMLALWAVRKPPRPGGRATHLERHANRLGTRHIELVLLAVDRGAVNKLTAYEMLNVRPEHFEGLRKEARERRAAYGRVG